MKTTMKIRRNYGWRRATVVLLTTTGAFVASAAQAADTIPGAPAGVLLSATACAASEVVNDAEALGGKAVTSGGEYSSLIEAKLPETDEAFTIWVHRKGGPIQLKAVVNGAQKEKKWDWGKPDGYEWCSLGRYKRADLGEAIVIIRSSKQAEKVPHIDAIVFSADAAAHPKGMKADGEKELPPEAPDNSLPATTASVQIDWSKTVGQMPPSIWGVNDSQVFDAKSAAAPDYQAFLASLTPALIRNLDGALISKWLDPKTRTWDVDMIKAGFAASTGYGKTRIILNIPSWPKWMTKQADKTTLTPESEEEFVKLVGQLVVLMRDEVHQPIAYWEVFNEQEEQFEKLGKLDVLWKLHNRVTAEIKKQDPKAKVGGPALTWPNPVWVESFLKVCAANVDFVTWHNYASGSIYDSNEKVLQGPDSIAGQARYIKEAVAKATAGRKVECFLDEYSIKWSWDPMERRHGNNVGVVFQACVLRRMGLLGLDGVTVWDSRHTAYGLYDGKARLTGRLYQIGSCCLIGAMADAAAQDNKDIELIATTRADGIRSVLLINRANHTVIVKGASKLNVSATTPTLVRIASDGLSVPLWNRELVSDELRLPGYSVTLVAGDASAAKLVEKTNDP